MALLLQFTNLQDGTQESGNGDIIRTAALGSRGAQVMPFYRDLIL